MSTFTKLKGDDLRAVAGAFAVEVTEADNDKTIRAALVEDGVTAKMVAEAFPDYAELVGLTKPVEEVKVEPVTPDVVTSPAARVAETKEVEEPVTVTNEVITDPGINFAQGGKFLVKMTRENPLFEIAGHRFTQDHPYALLDAERAEIVLSEDGFRQAKPSELREYYS